MVAAGVIGTRRTKSVGQKTRTAPRRTPNAKSFSAAAASSFARLTTKSPPNSPRESPTSSRLGPCSRRCAYLCTCRTWRSRSGSPARRVRFSSRSCFPAMAYRSVTAAGPRAPRTRARGAKLETDPAVEMTAAYVGANANRDGDDEEISRGRGAAGVSITGASKQAAAAGEGAPSGWEWFTDDDWGDDDDGWHSGGGTPPGGSPRSPVSRARPAPPLTNENRLGVGVGVVCARIGSRVDASLAPRRTRADRRGDVSVRRVHPGGDSRDASRETGRGGCENRRREGRVG